MHSWNLEKIYSKQVKNSVPVPPPNRLKILGESVSLYRKKGDDYELIGDVDDDYYDNTLSNYIKLGSPGSIELRKQILDILKKNNGNIGDNLNIFQSYVTDGGFNIDDSFLKKGEEVIYKYIEGNKGTFINKLIEEIYGSDVDVYNRYFSSAWKSVPKAPKFGRAGEGELFLAFLCNGSKPEKGDLRIGSENIELKGYDGRLFSSPPIDRKKYYSELIDGDFKDVDALLKGIAKTIGEVAGTNRFDDDIYELLTSEERKGKIIDEYIKLKRTNKLVMPSSSLFMKIASAVQLLAYKQDQKFDSMIAFNDKEAYGEDIWLQFINFKDISNLTEMWARINSLDSDLLIKGSYDGAGYQLKVFPKNAASADSAADGMTDNQNAELDRKKLAASARKVDTKDTGVGSLLDTQ